MMRVRDVCDDDDDDGVDVLQAISLIFHEEKGCVGCPIVALEVLFKPRTNTEIYLCGMSYPSGPPLAL